MATDGEATTFFTIGYEYATQPALIETLGAHRVRTLVDVRELPASRRVGFAKRSLSAGLAEAGIGYVHARDLGTPKEGRIANKAGDMPRFWHIVDEALARPEALVALDAVAELAKRSAVCLLCVEADPARCHRARVTALLAERHGLRVEHLRLAFEPSPVVATRPRRSPGR